MNSGRKLRSRPKRGGNENESVGDSSSSNEELDKKSLSRRIRNVLNRQKSRRGQSFSASDDNASKSSSASSVSRTRISKRVVKLITDAKKRKKQNDEFETLEGEDETSRASRRRGAPQSDIRNSSGRKTRKPARRGTPRSLRHTRSRRENAGESTPQGNMRSGQHESSSSSEAAQSQTRRNSSRATKRDGKSSRQTKRHTAQPTAKRDPKSSSGRASDDREEYTSSSSSDARRTARTRQSRKRNVPQKEESTLAASQRKRRSTRRITKISSDVESSSPLPSSSSEGPQTVRKNPRRTTTKSALDDGDETQAARKNPHRGTKRAKSATSSSDEEQISLRKPRSSRSYSEKIGSQPKARKRKGISPDSESQAGSSESALEEEEDEDESDSGRGKNKKQVSTFGRNNPDMSEMYEPDFPEDLEVEKILAYQKVKGTNMYLIKWKGYSYLHTEWKTEKALTRIDPGSARRRIEKYHRDIEDINTDEIGQLEMAEADEDEEPPFNEAFKTVQRFLGYYETDLPQGSEPPYPCKFANEGVMVHPETSKIKGVVRFAYVLVKWCQQSYENLTWEPVEVFDKATFEQKMTEFRSQNTLDIRKAREKYTPMKQMVKKVKQSQFVKLGGNITYRGWEKSGLKLKLRDYQLEGVNWLLWNWVVGRRGSMLADEMGLGKTIQVVALIQELRAGRAWSRSIRKKDQKWMRTKGPHLVVVPLSCVVQWQREFNTWTRLNVVVYHGGAWAREQIQDYEFFYRRSATYKGEDGRKQFQDEYTRFDVLVTTYELAVRDAAVLRQIRWRTLVVDEAHRLKNRDSKLNRELQTYRRDYTVLLTGTPIQNNTEELWALLNFLTAGGAEKQRVRKKSKMAEAEDETYWFRYENREEFLEEFGNVTTHDQLKTLHGLLRPFLLRRVKEDVGKQLPPKEETIVQVELTVVQKKYYRAIYEKNTSFLFRGNKPSNGPSLMNVVMELRKCCNHPFLNRGVEEAIIADELKQNEGLEEEVRTKNLVEASGKLILLDKLLPKLKDGEHKVLIFSQMVKMLDILEDFCHLRQFDFERLDGGVTGQERQEAIDRFSAPKSTHFIMLLSTRAGGLGLNLACADTVIIYDSDWNPQNDIQAQARSHRIGQTRAVKVYRLLTSKTYEMAMFQKASIKLGLDKAMVSTTKQEEGNKTSSGSKSKLGLSSEEVDMILKHGAYAAFGESDEASDEASKKFLNSSIEEILDKASHTVSLTNAGKTETTSVLGAFSKATFTSHKNAGLEIDIDDPEFWTKVAGLEAPDDDDDEAIAGGLSRAEILDSGSKRARKAVVRMGMILDRSSPLPLSLGSRNGSASASPGHSTDSENADSDVNSLPGGKKKKKKRKRKKKSKEKSSEQNEALKRAREKALLHRIRVEGPGSAVKASRGSKTSLAWSSRACKSVMRGLSKLGWGNWQLIRSEHALQSYGDEDRLERFASYLVRTVYNYALNEKAKSPVAARRIPRLSFDPDSTAKSILALANAVPVVIEEVQQAEKVLAKEAFVHSMLSGGAHSFFEQLQLVDDIHTVVTEGHNRAITDLTAKIAISSSVVKDDVNGVFDREKRANHMIVRVSIPDRQSAEIGFGIIKRLEKCVWVVTTVRKDSPVDKAGLLQPGDVLVSVNDFSTDQMTTISHFADAFYSPGTCTLKKSSMSLKEGEESKADKSVATDSETESSDPEAEVNGDGCKILLFETNGLRLPKQYASLKRTETDEGYPGAKVSVSVVDVVSEVKPFFDWSNEQVTKWAVPFLSGRCSSTGAYDISPFANFLNSSSCEVDGPMIDVICNQISAKLVDGGSNIISSRSSEVIAKSAEYLPIKTWDEWETFLVEVTARKMDKSNLIGRFPSSFQGLTFMDGKYPWTREMDMDLLIGIARYGLEDRELHVIGADSSLIFAQIIGVERATELLVKRKQAEKLRARYRKDLISEKKKRKKELEQQKEVGTKSAGESDQEGGNSNAVSGVSATAATRVIANAPLPMGPGDYFPPFDVLVKYVAALLYPNDMSRNTPTNSVSSSPKESSKKHYVGQEPYIIGNKESGSNSSNTGCAAESKKVSIGQEPYIIGMSSSSSSGVKNESEVVDLDTKTIAKETSSSSAVKNEQETAGPDTKTVSKERVVIDIAGEGAAVVKDKVPEQPNQEEQPKKRVKAITTDN